MSNKAIGGTVVVTGGAGYIGSRLIRDLARHERYAGSTLRILDNLHRSTFGAMADLPSEGRYEFVEGDILDPAMLRRVLSDADVVIHLAALAKTPFSFDHPTWTAHVNHWGTARLVEECLEAGVGRLIFASSCSVYGPGKGFTEEDECQPVGPYSESKRKAEEQVLSARERGLEAIVLRLGTVFGDAPAIRFDAVPNSLAYQACVGRSVTIHGDGLQQRPVVHVSDASSAILGVLNNELREAIYNVVAENVSIVEVAEAIEALRPFATIRYTAQDFMSRFSLSAGSGLLTSHTGWNPKVSLGEGLEQILDRYGCFEPQGDRTQEFAEV